MCLVGQASSPARDLVTAVKPYVHPQTALYSVGQYRETISPYLERTLTVVEFDGGRLTAEAGQAVHTRPGEWVRYSTPGEDGAEYVSVCLPAFAPDTVHRDG